MTGFLSLMIRFLRWLLRRPALARRSHPHAAVDRQSCASDEPGPIRSEEHHGVRHVGDLAEPRERRLPDYAADCGFGAREKAGGHHIARQLHAHVSRNEARIDAIDADAVAELARLH